jgi:Tc5 transposase DNA-binding domain
LNTMPGRPHKKECAEREVQMKITVEGVQDSTYISINRAVKALGVARTTLRRRLKGGKTRKEAREATQLLTAQEEKALADWITNATMSGNPVTHSYIKEVAEGIRTSHTDVANKYLRPIETTWLPGFFRRHPHLQTKLSKAMEMARVKDVTKEQIVNFNQDFHCLIHRKNIKHGNIYNCDKTGNLNDKEVS